MMIQVAAKWSQCLSLGSKGTPHQLWLYSLTAKGYALILWT